MAKKTQWNDLSGGRQVGLIILATVQIGLLVAALWDLAHRRADEVRGDRRMWAGLVFINWVGPLAYFMVGRKGFFSRLQALCSGTAAQAEE
ncbi:MAG: PLD nuclease N-terminal domain-containing protein [Actinomycetia bacterium]|nr:PLD nuclease N-terminal domain-containing protein [Actinomycetes bacterium]